MEKYLHQPELCKVLILLHKEVYASFAIVACQQNCVNELLLSQATAVSKKLILGWLFSRKLR